MPESKHGPYFLFKLFCLKNVRHQTAVSSQLTACTTLIYHFDTYDTRFHSLAFPPLLLADCHQALWVGMRSKIQNDGDEDWENAQVMFSPPSLCSVLQCPITSIGQLHDDVIFLQLQESFSLLISLFQLHLKTARSTSFTFILLAIHILHFDNR